jgi:BirA family transcriptional regulator, biotin operon repressor / biotin---[acetyl-CoA-carboxylase] ligase
MTDHPQIPTGDARIIRLPSVDSTSAEALRRVLAGEPPPFWIVADTQSAGRGRSGRSWASAPGNLLASLALRLDAPQSKAYQLALVTGVAMVEAIEHTMTFNEGEALRLKWPNDILVGTAKAGGILIESSVVGGVLTSIVGIGLNVSSPPEGLERDVTHLAAHGPAPAPGAILGPLATAMNRWIGLWAEGDGFDTVRKAWLLRAGPIGEALRINTGAETVEGLFAGLDPDGALIMRDSAGAERRFTYGDVSLAG